MGEPNANYHIMKLMQQTTFCGINSEDLLSNTPIMTVDCYKRGTELPVCQSCKINADNLEPQN